MTDLPTKTDLTSSGTTETEFQSAIGDLYDFIAQLADTGTKESLSISADAITPSQGIVILDTEASDATDNLKNISNTNLGGKVLFIRPVSSARTIVLKHMAGGGGQLYLTAAADLSMTNSQQMIAFLWNSSSSRWEEFWRNWGLWLPSAADIAAAKVAFGFGTAAFVNTGNGIGDIPLNTSAATLAALAYLSTVGASQITDGAVTNAKLAGSINKNKLADDTAGSLLMFNASTHADLLLAGTGNLGKPLLGGGDGQPPAYGDFPASIGGWTEIANESLSTLSDKQITWAEGAYDSILVQCYFEATNALFGVIRCRVYNGSTWQTTGYSGMKDTTGQWNPFDGDNSHAAASHFVARFDGVKQATFIRQFASVMGVIDGVGSYQGVWRRDTPMAISGFEIMRGSGGSGSFGANARLRILGM